MLAAALLAATAAATADGFNTHFLPAQLSALVELDFGLVKDAGYWDEEIREAYTEALGRNGPFRRVSETLAVNPETVKTLTFAVTARPAGGGQPKALIVVGGEFPFDKATKALADMGEKGELTTIKVHEQPVYFDHNEARAMYFTLIDAETLLISEDRALVKDALDGLHDARKPSPEVAAWLDFERAAPAAVRVSAMIPPEAKRGMGQVPQLKAVADKLDQIQFVGHLGDSPHGKLRVKATDTAAAVQLKGALDGLLLLGKMMNAANPDPRAADLMDKLSLRTDNAFLDVNLTLSKDIFEEMVKTQRQAGKEMRKKIRERRQKGGNAPPPAAAPAKKAA